MKQYLLLAIFFIYGFTTLAQVIGVSVSGRVVTQQNQKNLAFANVVVKTEEDGAFVTGTITNDEGRFSVNNLKSGSYLVQVSYSGYASQSFPLLVGTLSNSLDMGTLALLPDEKLLNEVVVSATQEPIGNKLDKKTYSVAANISQAGGSVLQALKNLPGVTTTQEGNVELRGSDKVAVLIDGKQTALTGFNSQSGLDNLPASAIKRIEIISNPSAKYDANGTAGIINIIFKKTGRKVSTAKLV